MITREEVRKKVSSRWLLNTANPFSFENRLLGEKDFNEVMDLIYGGTDDTQKL